MKTFSLSFLLIFAVTLLVNCNPKKNSQPTYNTYTNCESENTCNPYEVLNKFSLTSGQGEVSELVHKKSGARLVLVKNKDSNRAFTVGFRTPPYDDTGVFHVFEHAVLQGSRLYPSKSNFENVRSSSIASTMNAFTAPVKTYYPFATRDPKDFDNLLSFYMDAVFFPNAITDPRIIKREGWRYEVNPDTKELSINGIVFNEMKGRLTTNPYRSLLSHLNRFVLPQTPYAYESGGLPEKIPDLTFEQIQQTHKRYYHPQNSLIYIYGDLDFERILTTIDEQFLRHFTKTPEYQPVKISRQEGFNYSKDEVVETTFPAESGPNKDYLARAYAFLEEPDQESFAHWIAIRVLLNAFIGNSLSPLKLRLTEEGFSNASVSYTYSGSTGSWFLAFIFSGVEADQREQLGKILDEEIEKAISQGLDPELLTSIINQYEFSTKEQKINGTKRGNKLGDTVLSDWIDPDTIPLIEKLDIVTQFRQVRKLLEDQDFIKDFFREEFKENNHSLWLVMRPDPEFSEKLEAKIQKHIDKALKLKPLSEYEKEDKAFRKWVSSEEPPEVTGKTPLLELSDIKIDDKPIASSKSSMDSTEIIEYPQYTGGISYLTLFFDLQGIQQEDLKNLQLLTSLFTKTDTTHYPFQDLSKQINTYIGNLKISTSIYHSFKNPEELKPTMRVSLSFLNENREKSMSLLQEVLTQSQFLPIDRTQNHIDIQQTSMRNNISSRAINFAFNSIQRTFFPNYTGLTEQTNGLRFAQYLLDSNLDAEELIPVFKTMVSDIFNQDRLFLATLVANEQELKELKNSLAELKKSLPAAGSKDQNWSFPQQSTYDAYSIPTQVQTVIQVTPFKDQGLEYSGTMKVYSNYLNTNYMTPTFRERRGAYSTKSYFTRDGLFVMYTYSDPNLKETFDTFPEALEFMKNEELDQEKLRPAILGALKLFYDDVSNLQRTYHATSRYLIGRGWDDVIKTKQEILNTNLEDFQEITNALIPALENSEKTVVGNEDKIKQEAPFFENILSL